LSKGKEKSKALYIPRYTSKLLLLEESGLVGNIIFKMSRFYCFEKSRKRPILKISGTIQNNAASIRSISKKTGSLKDILNNGDSGAGKLW
jgi:hypothetical protein